MENIRQIIYDECIAQHGSVRAAASAIDVHVTTLYRFFEGADIMLGNVEKICEALKIKISVEKNGRR